MKKILIASVALAAVGAGTSASAADLAARPYTKARPPIVDPTYNWSGFYIGANAGYGWGREDHTDLLPGFGGFWTSGTFSPLGTTQRTKPAGAVYGGQAGYNWQSANWVFGVELAGGGANMRATDISIFFPGSDRISSRIDSTLTASGRLGYAFNNWLPYVKGGYAGARLKMSNFDIFGSHLDNSQWRSGYVVGAGLEYGFATNWIVGVEYNYMDFGTTSFSGQNLTATGVLFGTERFDDKLTVSTVTARLSYKFGGPVVAKY
ncbi:outer membrane protein [Tardiphaga robiniae]|uniref:outer membrane protein n=1 Tax=Tardiphaga TaxID=1395974 RepID=UPI0015864339|nr:outer membrane protein [Tardiphaga robiniae]MDR6659498.1 outer membrane immunogenic protein [Tardiphaga robiniae]NUU41636.1 porin family protein [Tardiphaga robiniae]